jgi:ATP-binding cassette subfamily B protein/subfamily B ATP-binding cassette protein MsbA
MNFAKLFDMFQSWQRLWPFIRPFKFQVITALVLGVLYAQLQVLLPLLGQALISAFENLGQEQSLRNLQEQAAATGGALLQDMPKDLKANSVFVKLKNLFQLPPDSTLLSLTNQQVVFYVAVAFPVYYFVFGVVRYFHLFLVKFIGDQVISSIRMSLMNKFLDLDVLYLGRQNKGSSGLISRTLNDTLILQHGLQFYADLIREPITAFFLVCWMFFINWQITLGCIVFLPIFITVIRVITKSLRRFGHESQEALEEVTKTLREGLDGVRVIQSFNLQNTMKQRFAAQVHHFLSRRKKIIKREELGSPINEWFASILVCGICLFQAQQIVTGESDLAAFIGFIITAGLLNHPIKKTQQAVIRIQQNVVALERLHEVLSSESHVVEPEHPRAFPEAWSYIDFNNVSFSYGEKNVLQDINLQIRKGEVVALVGESGSGKSTLAGLLQRFFDPISGSIEIGGVPIQEMQTRDLRAHLGYVTQDVFLFDDTVENNIWFGNLNRSKEDVPRAAEVANATHFINSALGGFQASVGERGGRLSGGEKQRISIARAVFKDPPILILDEATSALDSASEQEVQKGIEKLLQGRTALVIAHRLSTIINSDRIIVMKEGRIIEQGKHDELIKKNAEYARFYNLQYAERPLQV